MHRIVRAGIAAAGLAALVASLSVLSPPAPSDAQPVAPETASAASLVEPAKKEGTLVWYTSNTRPVGTAIKNAFEARYPGVSVSMYQAGGSQVLSKVEAELAHGGLRADVVDYSDGAAIVDQVRRNVLARFRPEGLDKVGSTMKDPNGYWVSQGFLTATIAYNPSKVAAGDVPTSWKDLTNPKWKGKTSMASPDYAGTALLILQGWRQALPADYLTSLAANKMRVLQSFGDTENNIVSGETPVGVVLSFRAYQDQEAGKPVRPIVPAEGQIALVTTTGISATAAHPAAARLFLSFLLSSDGQQIIAGAYLYPSRGDVPAKGALPAQGTLKLIWPDAAKLADPRYVGGLKEEFKNAFQ